MIRLAVSTHWQLRKLKIYTFTETRRQRPNSSWKLYFQGVVFRGWRKIPLSSRRYVYISMTNLDSILKNRSVTLPKKIYRVKAMVFPVVMYGCESWTIKKAEHQKIDAFELCWIRLLRILWTARRSSQSILKEINPEYSLEALMPKLKLQ